MSTPRIYDQRDRRIGDDQGRRHDAGGKREIVHREERRDEFDAVERERGDAVRMRALPGLGHRGAETEHADGRREYCRNRRLARQKIKYEKDRRGDEKRPFVPRKSSLAAPKAHQAQQQTNNRRDTHDPAAGPGRFIALYQIGGAGENAENQPGQWMRPRLATQRLPDVDAIGDERDDDGERPHRVFEGDHFIRPRDSGGGGPREAWWRGG